MSKYKRIPLKNYLVLVIIFILTGVLTIYLCQCYNIYNESKKDIPVIRNTLYEITPQELEHFIMENPTTLIYACTSRDEACRKYENHLIKLVNKNNLKEKMIYLNLTDEKQEEFINSFNEKYSAKIKLTNNYPAIISFDDGKITNILQEKNKNLTIKKTKNFIEMADQGE